MIESFKQLYKYRALVQALVTRHVAVRYRGSVLGFFWSLLNPLLLMLVYLLVFRYYIRFSEVDNYTIFLFCGLLPWIWMSSGLLEGTTAITASGHLITKSMFPAHILPTVTVISTLVNFVLSLPILLVFVLFSGLQLHWAWLFLPVLVLIQALLLNGFVVALSSLNVLFRDIQHLIGSFLTFLFFLCPIVYPASVVPEKFRFTLDWNPLAQLLMNYQNLILEGQLPSLWSMGYLCLWIAVSLLFGYALYGRYRESFAELL